MALRAARERPRARSCGGSASARPPTDPGIRVESAPRSRTSSHRRVAVCPSATANRSDVRRSRRRSRRAWPTGRRDPSLMYASHTDVRPIPVPTGACWRTGDLAPRTEPAAAASSPLDVQVQRRRRHVDGAPEANFWSWAWGKGAQASSICPQHIAINSGPTSRVQK